MFQNKYYAATDVGLQRDNNEDAFLASSNLGLWIVADGMGGHASGEVASAIVIETIQREVKSGHSLEQAIRLSHHDILKAANSGVGGMGMGSTVVALLSDDQKYQIGWVGDSRAYLFSKPQQDDQATSLRQLTTDHSYVQMLFESGAISEAELETHPEKNIITQCLGSVELSEVRVDQVAGEWMPQSKILLCSDGLSDVVRDAEIKQILSTHPKAQSAVKALIKAALDSGGKDNISAALIESPSALQIGLRRLKKALCC